MYFLDVDVRVWYKNIPRGNIYSLKRFQIEFNIFYKVLYPPNSMFEYCCAYFNDENVSEVNDPVEDICETPF